MRAARTRRGHLWILALAAWAAGTAVGSDSGDRSQGVPAAAELSVRLTPAAVEKLIQAAVPYDIRLDAGVFTQLVRISEPRDIRLFPGGITLRARATGSPVPLDVQLEPVIKLEAAPGGGYQVRVESLPVKVGWAGTFDLAGSIPVTPIGELTEFALDMPERSVPVQLQVTDIRVDAAGIRVEMITSYP